MKKYTGIEFRAAVEEVLGKVNTSLGLKPIRVEWTSEIQTAAINMDGKVLMANIPDNARVDHATLVRYCGMGAHELCHHAYTQWDTVACASGDSLLRQLHNAVEDAYIERRAIRAGLTGNIEALFKSLVGGMVTEALAEVSDWSNPAQYPFALAIYLRDHATTKVPLAQGLEPIFAEAARQFKSCGSSADALRIAEWVMAQLKTLPPECKNPNDPGDKSKQSKHPEGDRSGKPGRGQQQGQQGQQQGQQQGGKGQEQGQQEGQQGQQQGQAAGESGEGNGDEGEGQEGTQKAAGDAQKGEGEPTPQPGPAKAPTGQEEFRPVEPAVMAPDVGGSGGAGGTYCEAATLAAPGIHLDGGGMNTSITVPGALRYNLKRLFDNSSRTEFGLRRKAGAVDVNSLSKLGISDKLFKRRTEIEGIDSAVVILLDVSGSMRRNRLPAAVECCAALLDALDRAQVATSLLTFGSSTSMVKRWTDSKAKAIAALSKANAFGRTNDYFAVRYAHKLLSQRHETRKVCIVLSDGCGAVNETRQQVLNGEDIGITTIGIGIQVDVAEVYPQHINVQNLADLGAASFKQIKLAM